MEYWSAGVLVKQNSVSQYSNTPLLHYSMQVDYTGQIDSFRRQFASDNNAGICPEVLEALSGANVGHVVGYGHDSVTAQARALICEFFEREADVFFVFNGTAANSLAIGSATSSYQSVIAHRHSHVESDECNAPGFFNHGLKVVTADSADGKLTPGDVTEALADAREVHRSMPRVVSITNATELGTVYQANEIEAIAAVAQQHGLIVHLDGARLANAVVSVGCSVANLTWRVGVDVVSFGGTKNGMAFGEAVVFFRPDLARNFEYRMKQSGQLASKMRFLAAQWIGLLSGEVWRRNAERANAMAARLADKLTGVGIEILFPREANAVFGRLEQKAAEALWQRGWRFYLHVGPGGGARLMCSWDTTEEDVDAFAGDVAAVL
jgi:threonine aldolase